MVRRSDNFARKSVPSRDNDCGGVARTIEVARKTVRPEAGGEGSSRRKSSKPVKNAASNERKALKQIRLYGKNDFSIPRAPFYMCVKEALEKFIPNGGGERLRIQRAALDALQLSAEAYLVHLFEDMNLLTQHAKRKTLMFQDFHTLMRLRCNSFDNIMLDYKNSK